MNKEWNPGYYDLKGNFIIYEKKYYCNENKIIHGSEKEFQNCLKCNPKKMDKKLIAVYGTLRKGCGNHQHFLRNAEFKGEFATEPVYSLYTLGGFPGLKEDGNTSVQMEVYEVTPEEAVLIDSLEGYTPGRTPHFYDKKEIETPWGTAGVYIYVRDILEKNLIESGDWTNRNKIKIFEGVD